MFIYYFHTMLITEWRQKIDERAFSKTKRKDF